MKPLVLDFHRKDWASYRSGAVALFVAVIGAAVVLGMHIFMVAEIKKQESVWRNSQSRGDSVTVASQTGADKTERLKPELKRANEIVQQLATPWDQMFDAIEVFDPNQVALLRIETDMSRHALTITAESKSFNGMLEYAKSLTKQAALTDVYLVDHKILEEDESKPVRFSISASWKSGELR